MKISSSITWLLCRPRFFCNLNIWSEFLQALDVKFYIVVIWSNKKVMYNAMMCYSCIVMSIEFQIHICIKAPWNGPGSTPRSHRDFIILSSPNARNLISISYPVLYSFLRCQRSGPSLSFPSWPPIWRTGWWQRTSRTASLLSIRWQMTSELNIPMLISTTCSRWAIYSFSISE